VSIIYRIDEIVNVCRGKKVLNLGFVMHENWKDRLEKGVWLHQQIADVAEKVDGIDLLSEEVERINHALGQTNYSGDVTNLDDVPLNEKYDVIVCGELIEHIDNPGAMLKGIKRFMRDDSQLVITTPNAFSESWVRMAWNGREGRDFLNKQHVCWYSFHTLRQLLERHGYSEVKYDYYFSSNKKLSSFKPISTNLKNIIKSFFPKMHKNIAGSGVKSGGLFFVASLNSPHS
jgi:SAM-dependent methyltransferase